jgi:hypothetical protein
MVSILAAAARSFEVLVPTLKARINRRESAAERGHLVIFSLKSRAIIEIGYLIGNLAIAVSMVRCLRRII